MSKDAIAVSKEIRIKVGLDETNMPIKMEWSASDADKMQECKAMLLSLFDKDHRDTLKIDLWTKEMQIIEMDRFIYQTLKAIGDTYFKATQNKNLASDVQRFAQYFGEETEILPREK